MAEFARDLGWQPSEAFEATEVSDLASGHLLVEHGLQNTAVLTFLRRPIRYEELPRHQVEKLLTISYNNLVDWHIQIDSSLVSFVYNRATPPRAIERYPITHDDYDKLRSDAFESVVGRQPNPNVLALDDALIRTISLWKRAVSAELGYGVSTDAIAALFNSIIFIRATEDSRLLGSVNAEMSSDLSLLSIWNSPDGPTGLTELFSQSLARMGHAEPPQYVFNLERLSVFNSLSRETVNAMLTEFYTNRYAPYPYNFALMSKHALSRIYEHYVSLLRMEDSAQLTLYPSMPEEEFSKSYGSVYTPQFVARFFAKFLREHLPPFVFKRLRSIDPACGSGIFLRTLLEMQCDPIGNGVTGELIDLAFENVAGLDIDENAAQATRLSLALLYLVLVGHLPDRLKVERAEAVSYAESNPEISETFDVVVANPPFVALGTQNESRREKLAEYMGEHAKGRVDEYLAFLKLSLDLLKPGGFGLFVVPHSFLLSESARGVRRLLSEKTWVRCLADLSAIRVFGEKGSYVVLIIFQKRSGELPPSNAIVIKCQDMVGTALEQALQGCRTESRPFSIYEVDQASFLEPRWVMLPPGEAGIATKLKQLHRLDAFLEVREGLVSGADRIFIVTEELVPKGEEAVFRPFLHDREMLPFVVPKRTTKFVFYPFVGDRRIDRQELETGFPRTWSYLSSHEAELSRRGSARRGSIEWWEPERPRSPSEMFRPKIVSPHLAIVPKFGLDVEGEYAVSHAPLLYPRPGLLLPEYDLLRFFLAILNSTVCFWYVAAHSHTYERGYVMLERKTLVNTPVPDPAGVDFKDMQRLLNLVDRRSAQGLRPAPDIERAIDDLVATLYGLSTKEWRALSGD